MRKTKLKIRLFIAQLFDKYTDYCWADLVLWAYGNDSKLKDCKGKCNAPCYCGKFMNENIKE